MNNTDGANQTSQLNQPLLTVETVDKHIKQNSDNEEDVPQLQTTNINQPRVSNKVSLIKQKSSKTNKIFELEGIENVDEAVSPFTQQ